MRADRLHTWYMQLTDRCTNACAHCFSSCSPDARTVLPASLARKWIHQCAAIARGRLVFTGGEPFLFFAMLRNLVHEAASAGMSPAVWTNGYWITGPDEFRAALRYFADVGLKELIVSDDSFHGEAPFASFKPMIPEIARELGIGVQFSRIEPKNPDAPPDFLFPDHHALTGPVMHRGRAADACTPGQSRWQTGDFDSCPFLSFDAPQSLFIDAHGFLCICPGFPLANLQTMSIKRFFAEFDLQKSPLARRVAEGGPAAIARELSLPATTGFVDYCHACWALRRMWIEMTQN